MARIALLRVGLTGGIASGKSTVGDFLADLGALVLDADELAHTVMAPGGPAHDDVVRRFGADILDERGHIVRPRLAQIVFGDPDALQALNDLVHPRVRAEADRRFTEFARHSSLPIGILDAALLVETGAYRTFHRLIVVRCSADTQLRRLLERDGMTEQSARARLAAQAPTTDKVAVADYVIDTDGSLTDTRRQAEQTYASLLSDHEREFGE